ncbi:hypothetical protein Dalk_4805 [Desulfatibacillum aliphaticivorans]|uniref:Uncharacterized protein n=1 Tax=Desulfatibacillum aliphaticivorans TaxID=218208 RepID=B8FD51_DESAL|nr:hypothetical protein [Desulfatibacillum aliphaticivorans]ACL06482.1 hypothetical protein Dalk_4805 [Desulfatibacillum aliphaticivorans]
MQAIELLNIIRDGFEHAYRLKDNGKFAESPEGKRGNNSRRSAKFVFEVGKRLYKHIDPDENQFKLHVQKVEDDGKKDPGEWLFDICITKSIKISDSYKNKNDENKNSAQMNTEILWIVESEYNTSIREFAADFGKLYCSYAQNLLYLHGLNQKTERGRNAFVKRRIKTIEEVWNNRSNDSQRLFIGFWPSPEIKDGKSLWDAENQDESLVDWIRLFEWRGNSLCEIK